MPVKVTRRVETAKKWIVDLPGFERWHTDFPFRATVKDDVYEIMEFYLD